MTYTITITKGNQYDQDGFHITYGLLYGFGAADASKASGYNLNGNCRLGADHYDRYQEQFDAAILATLADGLERHIQMQPTDTQAAGTLPESHACPQCGTYCMGDCDRVDTTAKDYCSQNDGDCETCSLVNYGRDCHNQPV